jgi:exopolysaccharide biosynthesis polyprenyl glycosylphosphotransferase
MSTSESLKFPVVEDDKQPSMQDRAPLAVGRRFEHFFTLLEMATDAATIFTGLSLAFVLYQRTGADYSGLPTVEAALPWALIFVAIMIMMLDRVGAYRLGNSLLRIRETERALRASLYSFLLLLLVSVLLSHPFPRRLVLIAVVFVPMALVAEKQIGFSILNRLHGKGYGRQRVLIYGSGLAGKQIFSTLMRSPKLGLLPVAMVDDNRSSSQFRCKIYASDYWHRNHVEVLPGPLTTERILMHRAEMVIVANSQLDPSAAAQVVRSAEAAGASVAFTPSGDAALRCAVDYVDLDGLLLGFRRPVSPRLLYEATKRLFDFCMAAQLLLIFAPIFALTALLVRMDSSGPVFFRQTRIGKDGQPFTMYKFRSMHSSLCGSDFSPISHTDSRITRVGRFLRRSSLDELPQLINVLKGDMSLVGPRPEMPFIVQQYGPLERQRLQAKPGITGLWQLSADRRFLIHENIQYDLYYVDNRGLFLDFAILLHTFLFAMHGV